MFICHLGSPTRVSMPIVAWMVLLIGAGISTRTAASPEESCIQANVSRECLIPQMRDQAGHISEVAASQTSAGLPTPDNLPIARQDLKVFHYGTVKPPLVKLPNTIPLSNATPQTFSLTPQKPYIEGVGAVFAFYPFAFDGFLNSISFEENIAPQGKTSSLELMVYLPAGRTFIFDENVLVGGGSGCQFIVTGPDGTKTTITCSVPELQIQHLTFSYSGAQTGWVFFETSGVNQIIWDFNGVVITQEQ
jgi:hypothetical protein